MKNLIRYSALALLLLVVCAPLPAGADGNNGASAHGDLRFTMADGVMRFLEFEAREGKDGKAAGWMTFSAQGELPDQDVDGEGPSVLPAGVYMKALFDCVVVSDKRAVMSGEIAETNVAGYVGRRVLLVVEDGRASQDRLTWGVYAQPGKLDLRDAELMKEGEEYPKEPTTWIARDAERPDDVGVEFSRQGPMGCNNFPLSSYSFVDVKQGDGNIHVIGPRQGGN